MTGALPGAKDVRKGAGHKTPTSHAVLGPQSGCDAEMSGCTWGDREQTSKLPTRKGSHRHTKEAPVAWKICGSGATLAFASTKAVAHPVKRKKWVEGNFSFARELKQSHRIGLRFHVQLCCGPACSLYHCHSIRTELQLHHTPANCLSRSAETTYE